MIYISAKKKANEKKNEMSVKINVQTHKFKTIIVKMRCFHSTASHFYHALEFSSDGQYYRYKFSLQIQISSFPREIINLRAQLLRIKSVMRRYFIEKRFLFKSKQYLSLEVELFFGRFFTSSRTFNIQLRPGAGRSRLLFERQNLHPMRVARFCLLSFFAWTQKAYRDKSLK